METIVMVVVGLAVLLVVLGIFGTQSRKGSKGLDEVSTATDQQAKAQMCIGDDVECVSSSECNEPNAQKKCFLPGTVCCEKSESVE